MNRAMGKYVQKVAEGSTCSGHRRTEEHLKLGHTKPGFLDDKRIELA
jgi:hypothetical protein